MTKNLVIVFVLLSLVSVSNAEIIRMEKYGLKPDSKENALPYLKQALLEAKKYKNSTILFQKGKYNFIPDIPGGFSLKTYVAIQINNINNLVVNGQGSEFIFKGRTIPFVVTNCSNIMLTNFSIDWDRPMLTQGEFIAVNDSYVDFKIDKKQYPYEISDGKVFYLGEGWRMNECLDNNIFDKLTGNIIPQTHDNSAGDFFKGKAIEIRPGVIRFSGPFNWKRKPEVTNIVTMYHGIYVAVSFNIRNSKDIKVKNIIVYHGGSMGILADFTENITIDNFDIIANESKGRVFSIMADGIHLKGCKGLIKIENCEYNGGGDDWVNVHSMYSLVTRVKDKRNIEVLCHKGVFLKPGEDVWFVNQKTGQRAAIGKLISINFLKGDSWDGIANLSFEENIPDFITTDDAIESADWIPEVEIRNNRILKRHRATGIRVTTPKNVVIERNYFNTAGTAILIEGDYKFWLESGAINNLVIRNNIFDNCLTSGSEYGTKWEWGEAIINITPSLRPSSEEDSVFHRNILITDNTFRFFDFPVLRARSVGDLQFINNKLVRTYNYESYGWIKSNFLLEGCRNVKIQNNTFSKDFLGKNITTTYMKPTDLIVDPTQGLMVTRDDKLYVDSYIDMKVKRKY